MRSGATFKHRVSVSSKQKAEDRPLASSKLKWPLLAHIDENQRSSNAGC
jgi:hypothetical protein